MINILTRLYEVVTLTLEVTAQTRQKLHILYLLPVSVTLTFDIGSWVLYATHILITINILTKLYENATITCDVIARTRSDGRTYSLPHRHSKFIAAMPRSPQADSTKNRSIM